MIRVLVPIDAFSHLTLSAAYFALEFAKRHPARVFFLMLDTAAGPAAAPGPTAAMDCRWPALFHQLLQRGREQQVKLEIHHAQGDFLQAIQRVAQQYNIDDIIMAVAPEGDATHRQILRRIELLRHQGQYHIITVKPKEVGKILEVLAKKESGPMAS